MYHRSIDGLTVPRRNIFKTGESRRAFFRTEAPLNPTTTNLFLLSARSAKRAAGSGAAHPDTRSVSNGGSGGDAERGGGVNKRKIHILCTSDIEGMSEY